VNSTISIFLTCWLQLICSPVFSYAALMIQDISRQGIRLVDQFCIIYLPCFIITKPDNLSYLTPTLALRHACSFPLFLPWQTKHSALLKLVLWERVNPWMNMVGHHPCWAVNSFPLKDVPFFSITEKICGFIITSPRLFNICFVRCFCITVYMPKSSLLHQLLSTDVIEAFVDWNKFLFPKTSSLVNEHN
jgi:hypothetical protein